MDKVCIVGYGAIGPTHAAAITKTEYAELYAVCECDAERLAKASTAYPEIVTFESFDEMLKDEAITSVHICTPHYLHFEMAKKVILSGRKLVLEKPVAMNEEEFDELSELCRTHPNKVCIMFQNRYSACTQELLKRSKELGELKGIFAALTWHKTMDYYNHDAWRGKLATEGGGVLINQSIHLLDILLLIGGEVESVRASCSTKYLPIEVEDTLDALITLKNGARTCFYATNAYVTDSPFRLEAIFEKGTLKLEDDSLYLYADGNMTKLATNSGNFCGKAYWGSGHQYLTELFYSGGEYPTIFDTENTMRTMFAIYEDARKS